MKPQGILALMLLQLPGCGPGSASQILLFVDTDAPLSPATGMMPDPEALPALFDRLRVDIYVPGSTVPCADCGREFGVDTDLFASLSASIGIPAPPGEPGYVARVRLFRAGFLAAGEARADSSIDVWAALPTVERGEVREVSVFLRTDEVARPRGAPPDSPVEALRGRPTASLVGTWPGARHQPTCHEPPREGEACLAGGAFWMGNARNTNPSSNEDSDEQRLVVISPFFLDRHEVTVGELRRWIRANPLRASLVLAWSGSNAGAVANDFCTYAANGVNDDVAVNCVPWDLAALYCLEAGRVLPSEAQLEYAMGARVSSRYVWGADEPACGDAVHALGGEPYLRHRPGYCRQPGTHAGPRRPGQGVRDRLAAPGGEIVDLAGNVREMTRDLWNEVDGDCWQAGVVRDPECHPPAGAVRNARRTVKGGDFGSPPQAMRSGVRIELRFDDVDIGVGFRCARPGAAP